LDRQRLDCQIKHDAKNHRGTLRPAIDWQVNPNLAVGAEARFDSDSNKNYFGFRLALSFDKEF
jgi:hypothetical protein